MHLKRLHEIDRSRYSKADSVLLDDEFMTRQIFADSLLRANKRLRTSSGIIVDVASLETRWVPDMHFISVDGIEPEWRKSCSAELVKGGGRSRCAGNASLVIPQLVLSERRRTESTCEEHKF